MIILKYSFAFASEERMKKNMINETIVIVVVVFRVIGDYMPERFHVY